MATEGGRLPNVICRRSALAQARACSGLRARHSAQALRSLTLTWDEFNCTSQVAASSRIWEGMGSCRCMDLLLHQRQTLAERLLHIALHRGQRHTDVAGNVLVFHAFQLR